MAGSGSLEELFEWLELDENEIAGSLPGNGTGPLPVTLAQNSRSLPAALSHWSEDRFFQEYLWKEREDWGKEIIESARAARTVSERRERSHTVETNASSIQVGGPVTQRSYT